MKPSLQHANTYQEKIGEDLYLSLIKVAGGTYEMGGKENEEGHQVTLSDFYIGQYPITTAQYFQFANETDSHFPEWLEEGNKFNIQSGSVDFYQQLSEALTHPFHPIIGVSWHNAVAYCEWLSQKTKWKYRLPAESEWEYSARGGRYSSGFQFAGGYKLKEVAWYNLNSSRETKKVGLKLPNELGLYDMSGNVDEWCQDHWQDEVKQIPQDGSAWLNLEEPVDPNAARVVRGGSWNFPEVFCYVSQRSWFTAYYRRDNVGFRVVRD